MRSDEETLSRTFLAGPSWAGLHAAQEWCREHGFICGHLQRDAPIGVHRESESAGISKWRNLGESDRLALDGQIVTAEVGGSFRDGAARLVIRRSVVAEIANAEAPLWKDGTHPVAPASVPLAYWGKDHWSTFGFVAHWCAFYGEQGFTIGNKRDNMRTDPKLHPMLVGRHIGQWGVDAKKYPTRTKRGEVENHDDWSCLEDCERLGFVRREGSGVNPVYFMTEVGLQVAAELTAHKTAGGNFHGFAPSEAALKVAA